MRGIKIFVIGIFLFMVINSHFLFCLEDDEWDKDNYGKIIGQIVDAETGEPVNEEFIVYIFRQSINNWADIPGNTYTTTDNKGQFYFKWKPGLYSLHCYPKSELSKYSCDPSPFNYPETRQNITVEKGKITKVIKKVYLGGKIKIVLTNPNGEKINPNTLFDRSDIIEDLESDVLMTQTGPLYSIGTINDGEVIKTTLYPGKYSLDIVFRDMGYGRIRIENIIVEEKQTTEVNVVVDLNDNTGIQGQILDQNNNPVEGVRVEATEINEQGNYNKSGSVYTDNNGYYKIIGLNDGLYDIYYRKVFDNLTAVLIPSDKVYIQKNNITIKNKKINL